MIPPGLSKQQVLEPVSDPHVSMFVLGQVNQVLSKSSLGRKKFGIDTACAQAARIIGAKAFMLSSCVRQESC